MSIQYKLKVGSNNIGRDSSNDIVLKGEVSTVSNFHAKITITKQNQGYIFFLEDFSTNGTKVNGCNVKLAYLVHGDIMKFGDMVLLLMATQMLLSDDLSFRQKPSQNVQFNIRSPFQISQSEDGFGRSYLSTKDDETHQNKTVEMSNAIRVNFGKIESYKTKKIEKTNLIANSFQQYRDMSPWLMVILDLFLVNQQDVIDCLCFSDCIISFDDVFKLKEILINVFNSNVSVSQLSISMSGIDDVFFIALVELSVVLNVRQLVLEGTRLTPVSINRLLSVKMSDGLKVYVNKDGNDAFFRSAWVRCVKGG